MTTHSDSMTSSLFDLHCHSSASDGSLTPTDVVKRAVDQGVQTLAITDHDTVNGQTEALAAARKYQLNLIPGIEISTTWENKCFHIVGLNIDPNNSDLNEGIRNLQTIRTERALKIANRLDKKNIPNAFEAVIADAGDRMITRAHFADFLYQNQYVSSQQEAFDRYLGKGKPAYVNTIWADLAESIAWIKHAGGIAVIAHPMRYQMTASWMQRFLTFFKDSGGQAIEVVTGRTNADEIQRSLYYANRFNLAGSVGSDFHSPNNPWVELGRLQTLPHSVRPVWELF